MSLDVMTAVWKHSVAKGTELLTLLAIADNADDDGFCFPSYPHLAAKTRMSERQVRRIVTALCDTDELSLIASGRGGRANEYSVNVAHLRSKQIQLGATPKRRGQDVKQPDIEVDTTWPPQPSSFQPTTDVANATPADTDGDQNALFDSPEVTPPVKPDPLGAAVREVWEHHVELFQPSRPDLTKSRDGAIRRGFKEIMAGREEPSREDIDYLKRASDGLQVWRRQKPGDVGVGAIYQTYPGGKPLGDQIDFFVQQATSGGTSASPRVPSVMSGTITQKKREVVDMLAYPDSPDHKQRGLAAIEWLKDEIGQEPIITEGVLQGWQAPDPQVSS